jgi:hypothetical protein
MQIGGNKIGACDISPADPYAEANLIINKPLI